MPAKRKLSPLPVFDMPSLMSKFAEAGLKTSNIPKLYSFLIKNPDAGWHDMPDLPKSALHVLDTFFTRSTSRVLETSRGDCGDSTKLLVQLQDGLQVESVLLLYDTTTLQPDGVTTGSQRATLCISSQVGCQMGCTFCATGTMGLRGMLLRVPLCIRVMSTAVLKGDLLGGEIVEQLVHARRIMPVRNVVFMGMGEPLNNYDAVRSAVSMMTDGGMFAMRRKAVTVSTVGVIPRIRQLVQDLPGVSLALSLHAPNQELRKELVPSARAYKLDKLMDAIHEYQNNPDNPNPKVFVEYVLLAGVNDGPEQAHELGRLLTGCNVVINLIPWNPVYSPGMPYRAPGMEAATLFHGIVRNEYGLPCTVRKEKGQDIAGACGQLVIEAGKRKIDADIEDIMVKT